MHFRDRLSKARLRMRDAVATGRKLVTQPVDESPSDNVFHCCVHKSGSQWIRRILNDARVYRYSGLSAFHYQSMFPGGHDPRPVNARRFDHSFPSRTIITPLYIDYAGYTSVPKPPTSRAFFVTRDPRDIVVSWYFSSRYSHRVMGDLGQVRSILADLDQATGLQYSIAHLAEFGLFDAQRSWMSAMDDRSVIVVRYEDLIGPHGRDLFQTLFEHIRVEMPASVLDAVLEASSFERLSGRSRGEEDVSSHLRKGTAGDWQSYFDADVSATFGELTGDLVRELGYS